MITWAGRIMMFYGAAHTIGALTVEGAARHAGAWFRGDLWRADFGDMTPATSAYWLSVGSFGIPLILLGATVLWMDRHRITPPQFLAWTMILWCVIDATILLLTPWPIFLGAAIMLLAGIRRAGRQDSLTPGSVTLRVGQ